VANPNVCGTALNGAPLLSMRPFLVPIEVKTGIKNTLNKTHQFTDQWQ